MHVEPRLGERRLDVAVRAPALALEEALATPGGAPVETAPRGLGRRQRELVELQRRQLGGDAVTPAAGVAHAVARGDRGLLPVVEARGGAVAPTVQLEVAEDRVPAGDGPPAGVGVAVDAGEPERGRDERASGLAVRPQALAV